MSDRSEPANRSVPERDTRPEFEIRVSPAADEDVEVAIVEIVRLLLSDQGKSEPIAQPANGWSRAALREAQRTPFWTLQTESWQRTNRNGAR